MLSIRHCENTDPDFAALVKLLDAELAQRDGKAHAFYHQFNSSTFLKPVVLAYEDGIPVACGALKNYTDDTMEVKRMYTLPAYRGKKIAAAVLSELEKLCAAAGNGYCVLETGIQQPEAIRLYERSGYSRIANYGQYSDVSNSVCMRKKLF